MIKFANIEKEKVVDRMEDKLHMVMLKKAAEEAQEMGTLNKAISEDSGNYVVRKKTEMKDRVAASRQKDEETFGGDPVSPEFEEMQMMRHKELSYYFPLRNEKNADFLVDHLRFLEEESKASDLNIHLQDRYNKTLMSKIRILRRDILIFRGRITELKALLKQVIVGYRMMLTTKHTSHTINHNIMIKNENMHKIKREIVDKFQNLRDSLKQIKQTAVSFD